MDHRIRPAAGASGSTQSDRRPRKEAKRVLIAVFGTTGTGKSTLIQKLSGQKLNIGHNLKSCTQEIEEVNCQIGDYPVTLVDTPGFDDSERSDTEILSLIADWLQSSYEAGTFLSGIIYLHRISDVRMSGSSIKNLRMFRKLCGADNMTSVHLVTTMWEKVTMAEGERRERDLQVSDGFWAPMIASGCTVKRHDGSSKSANDLVADLLEQSPVVIRLQKEIASGKNLCETEAGISINEEILRVQKKYELELEAVKEEMEFAMKAGNKALQKELEKQHAKTVADITRKANEHAQLMDAKTRRLEQQMQDDNQRHSQQVQNLQGELGRLASQKREAEREAERARESLEWKLDDQRDSVERLREELGQLRTSRSMPSRGPPVIDTHNPFPRDLILYPATVLRFHYPGRATVRCWPAGHPTYCRCEECHYSCWGVGEVYNNIPGKAYTCDCGKGWVVDDL